MSTLSNDNNASNDIEAIADIAAAAVEQHQKEAAAVVVPPIPAPFPPGWVLRESRSHPEYYYYFHQETGECSWTPPFAPVGAVSDAAAASAATPGSHPMEDTDPTESMPYEGDDDNNAPPPNKKRRTEDHTSTETPSVSTSQNEVPSKVRVLHILKKHKDSRRPSSWRVPDITITPAEARAELEGLLEVLQEVQDDKKELRATMEELARTESDCSSAKRGGDLGFFGPRKMQPAFEEASFALSLYELSGIVSTQSGVHVILRIG